jgi:hypothetical protein
MSSQSKWAAALLPFAPSREVADRLFVLVEDSDLYGISLPDVGLTFPSGKHSAVRAEVLAKAVRDEVDIAKMEKDSRKGVRRTLGSNPAARSVWADRVIAKALEEFDAETLDALVPAASAEMLVEVMNRKWHVDTAVQQLARLLPSMPLEMQLAVASSLGAFNPLPSPFGRLSSTSRLLSALVAEVDISLLCRHVPEISGSFLWEMVSSHPVDVKVARLLVEHHASLEGLKAALEKRHSGKVPFNGLQAPHGVDPDAASVLLDEDSTLLATVVAEGASIDDQNIGQVLRLADNTTLRALLRNENVALSPLWADRFGLSVAVFLDSCLSKGGPNRREYLSEMARDTLNYPHPYSGDVVLAVLRNSSFKVVQAWLSGDLHVKPSEGQITDLFRSPGHSFEVADWTVMTAAGQIVDTDLPWSKEVVLVTSRLESFSPHLFRISYGEGKSLLSSSVDLMSPILGEDPELWATFCTLAATFPGTFQELAATTVAVSS